MGFKKTAEGYYYYPRGKINPNILVKQTVSGTSYCGYLNIGRLSIKKVPKEFIGKYVRLKLEISNKNDFKKTVR